MVVKILYFLSAVFVLKLEKIKKATVISLFYTFFYWYGFPCHKQLRYDLTNSIFDKNSQNCGCLTYSSSHHCIVLVLAAAHHLLPDGLTCLWVSCCVLNHLNSNILLHHSQLTCLGIHRPLVVWLYPA